MQELPTFRSIQAHLYRLRRQYIPRAPTTQVELNVNLPWFVIQTNQEHIVKGNRTTGLGTRIILFSTEENLRQLARARTLCFDGTFRTAPRLWYQLFILNIETAEDVYCPAVFAYLPDKRQ